MSASSSRAELRAREQRHDRAGRQDEEGRDRAQRDQKDPEQRRGQPERLALLALLQQVGEHRHERRRQGRVGEQLRDEIGDSERRSCTPTRPAARAEEARGAISRTSPTTREMPVAIEKIAVLRAPRCPERGGLRCARSLGLQALTDTGRYSTALRGAPRAVCLGPQASLSHGQHRIPKEAHPALRARAPGEPPIHLGDQDLLPSPGGARQGERQRRPPRPSTVASCARSTRPSSAARCIATPARARSPAQHVVASPAPSS